MILKQKNKTIGFFGVFILATVAFASAALISPTSVSAVSPCGTKTALEKISCDSGYKNGNCDGKGGWSNYSNKAALDAACEEGARAKVADSATPAPNNQTCVPKGTTGPLAPGKTYCPDPAPGNNGTPGSTSNNGAGSDGAVGSCKAGGVLSFPRWYDGLCEGGKIKPPGDDIGKFIWTIVLNIIAMMLYVVGYVSLGFIIYGGFKYMISGDNASGTAAARKTILNAVIGLVLSIMSVGIVNVIAGAVK